ncbi:MAG: DegV family EDD domain-containing protein [Lachnospiraceae bacterium]|nr:DegV family EDD domain-containing protein [Lachnospiraceae bacterium]
MKKWIAALFDHRIDLQERTYRLAGVLGLAALIVMGVLSVIMQESASDILCIISGLLVFVLIFVGSIYIHRIQTGATIISTILIFIILPAVYFASGGMYGGTPMWFLFAVIFVSIVLRGRRRFFFIAGSGVVLAVCYVVQWYYPATVIPHTAKMAYTDSLASALIVGFFASLMIIFETNLYVEEQRIAEERRHKIEELNRAQNRFFSNMSHEIRTPINTIIGLNEMIMREAVTVEVAEDARSIQGAGQLLLALINDILDMSKIESGRMDLIPNTYALGDLISEVVNMIWAPAREKGLEFHVDLDETAPRSLIGDDIRIKQILINLLNNAVKYTRDGSVTLSVECRRPAGAKQVDMIFAVTDTGTGIKKESLPMLFDVFRRVDEEKNRYIEGTGLGLSIVKQLVDLMGGEITVDSVYTKGSTFRVRIPQDVAEDRPVGKLTLRSGDRTRREDGFKQSFEAPGASVLIVDDNELNASVAAKLLAATKMHIDLAESGARCLSLTQDRRYDVILMDHLMPEMDGIETLEAIRAQAGGMNRQTPVVALTANAGSENQALYRRSGFDGYLIKPVTGAQLEEAVLDKLSPQLVTYTGIATVHAGENMLDVHKRKKSIVITTESSCDLPDQMLLLHHIEVLPYRIRTEEGVFIDRTEVSTSEAISYMMQRNKRPIDVLPPAVEDYQNFFAERLGRAEHVFHLTTSAAGEKAYQNASDAAHSFGNVTVFDTKQLSGGLGMLAVLASRIAETENLTPDALYAAVDDMRLHVRAMVALDSTERLMASDKISPRLYGVLRSFMLRPILSSDRGQLRLKGVLAGPRQQYLASFVKKSFGANVDRTRLLVLSPNLLPDDAKRLEAEIKKRIPFQEIRFLQTGASSTLMWGTDAVEFVFLTKS